jgi:VIT1/CCC1 family predicted Fe2+/Mn2+ transporter
MGVMQHRCGVLTTLRESMTSNHQADRVRGILGIIGDFALCWLAWVFWNDHLALGLRLAALLTALGALLWSISWLVHGHPRRMCARISILFLGVALVSFFVFRS